MKAHTELVQQLRTQLKKSARQNLPRYKQLYEVLRQQILDGLLLSGTCLPSSRILAEQLGIARNTALAALEQLCAEGYAAARPASGIYILPTAPMQWATANIAANSASNLGLSARGERISQQSQSSLLRGAFTIGLPDVKQFPFELWQRYVTRHARNPKLDWLGYPQQGGHIDLRTTIVDYLRMARGIRCDAGQILITHGTQHSLQLVADLLANPGDSAWVEDPGYRGVRSAFDAAGLKLINQPVDAEGLAPTNKAWQKPPRLIYTTPSHQSPTGVVMSAARRRNLLAAAAQNNTWVIEDDYDSEFRYAGTPLAALHALAPNQVIYMGSFSKVLFPALRIGYMVLPQNLVDAFRATQARHHREPSYIVQKALADFIRDGHANAFIRKMRREYQARRDALLELMHTKLGNLVNFSSIDTGLHFVMHLPPHLNDQKISAQAHQRGIVARALSSSYAGVAPANTSALLLGFGAADLDDIARAGKLLIKIINAT